MRLKYLGLACLSMLWACGPVLEETRTTKQLTSGYYAGESYDLVTRVIDGPNGPYKQTRVVYWNRSAPCILDSPGDCEKAARRMIDESFSFGLF